MRVFEGQEWPEYVRRVAGSMTQAQIATRVGSVSTANVGRWVRGEPGQPNAENVIAFAKAFLARSGKRWPQPEYLDEADVATSTRTPLSEYPTAELFDELRRRTQD
jgi:transcriptional regulator with XRE-family HTH domain